MKKLFRKIYTKTSFILSEMKGIFTYVQYNHHVDNIDTFIKIMKCIHSDSLIIFISQWNDKTSNVIGNVQIHSKTTQQSTKIIYCSSYFKSIDIINIIQNLKNSTIKTLDISILNNCKINNDIMFSLIESIKDTNITTIKWEININSELEHALIKGFKNTSVTNFISDHYSYEIEQVLKDNKDNMIQLRNAFKTLVYKTYNHKLEFDISCINSEKCIDIRPYLKFIKTINNVQPHAVCNYLRETPYTTNEIQHFIKNIANKFAQLIATKIDGNSTDYSNILMMCENMQLEELTKTLLLHRPLYLIEPKLGILHPYFYQILKKYNMPLYNEQIEPSIKEKILSYYDSHPEVDGAQNVINLLGSESIEVYI